jgi:two-component system, sporulation sensor kinase E
MKELELIEEYADGNDIIFCDPIGIQHIFVALFINAIEATSKGGKLKVKTELINGGNDFRIMVSDTGCGIPEDIIPHIFEPFFSTKESSGLGLAVVYSIIEQHEGKIEVESKLNEGTTFFIQLPRRPLRNKKELEITQNLPSA